MKKKKKKDKKKHVKEEPLSEEEPCTSTAVAVCFFLIINILLTWAELPYFILCMLEISSFLKLFLKMVSLKRNN